MAHTTQHMKPQRRHNWMDSHWRCHHVACPRRLAGSNVKKKPAKEMAFPRKAVKRTVREVLPEGYSISAAGLDCLHQAAEVAIVQLFKDSRLWPSIHHDWSYIQQICVWLQACVPMTSLSVDGIHRVQPVPEKEGEDHVPIVTVTPNFGDFIKSTPKSRIPKKNMFFEELQPKSLRKQCSFSKTVVWVGFPKGNFIKSTPKSRIPNKNMFFEEIQAKSLRKQCSFSKNSCLGRIPKR